MNRGNIYFGGATGFTFGASTIYSGVRGLLLMTKSYAGLILEPEVGYATGSITADYKDISGGGVDSFSKDFDMKGLNYGGKVGFSLGDFQLMGEYVHNSSKIDGENYPINETAALLGYRFGFFRIYGGYIFKANATEDDVDGTGTKFGFSFYALKNMALNLEYRMVKLDDINDSDGSLSYKYKTLAVMLSFPFELF